MEKLQLTGRSKPCHLQMERVIKKGQSKGRVLRFAQIPKENWRLLGVISSSAHVHAIISAKLRS
jgi:hypothetical protein